jgi:hypothetical protein
LTIIKDGHDPGRAVQRKRISSVEELEESDFHIRGVKIYKEQQRETKGQSSEEIRRE